MSDIPETPPVEPVESVETSSDAWLAGTILVGALLLAIGFVMYMWKKNSSSGEDR